MLDRSVFFLMTKKKFSFKKYLNYFTNAILIFLTLIFTSGITAMAVPVVATADTAANRSTAMSKAQSERDECIRATSVLADADRKAAAKTQCSINYKDIKSAITQFQAVAEENLEQKKCDESYKDYNERKTELGTACASAKAGANCENQLARCTACLNQSSESETFGCEEDASDETLSVSGRSFRSPPSSLAKNKKIIQLKKQFKSCPLLASEDLDELKKNLKDEKEEVEATEKEIVKKEKDLIDLKEELEKAKQKYEEYSDTLEKNMKEQIAELEEDLRSLKGNYEKEIFDQQEKLVEKNNELRILVLADQQAKDDYEDAVSELEFGCLNQAQEQLSQLRGKQSLLIATSSYTTRSFSNLLGRTGLSNRAKGLRLLNGYTKRCIASSISKNRVKKYKRKLEGSLKINAEAKKRLEAKKESLKTSMASLRKKLPAKGEAIIKKIDDIVKEREKAEDRNLKEYRVAYGKIQSQINLLQKELGGNHQSSLLFAGQGKLGQKQYSGLRAKLALAKSDQQDVVKEYSLKKQYSISGSSVSAKDTSTAFGAIGNLKSSAISVLNSCKCPVPPATRLRVTRPGTPAAAAAAAAAAADASLNTAACHSANDSLGKIFNSHDRDQWSDEVTDAVVGVP